MISKIQDSEYSTGNVYIKNSKGSSKIISLGDQSMNNTSNWTEATIVKLVVDSLLPSPFGPRQFSNFALSVITKKNGLLEIAVLTHH